MSLAGRLSAFFLASLAVVLIGFSAAVFLLARGHLRRQVDARLETALDTLAAAAEIDARGVEWEPDERQLNLGGDPGIDQVRWAIRDEAGRLIDRSRNAADGNAPPSWGLPRAGGPAAGRKSGLAPWREARRRLLPNPAPGIRSEPHDVRHARLDLAVGVSLRPIRSTLTSLAVALVALSAGTWVVAAGLGRWLSRRALAPLSRMASTARGMSAADLERRLPEPGTGDELDDLSRAFNDLLGRLHEAFERQRRFTGDASHQLRTPLAALLGQVEVALRRDRSDAEYRRVLEVVERRATQLRQILESLLFLARAETEAGLPDLKPLDLGDWLVEHARRWSEHPRAADLRVAREEDESLRARVHVSLLGQAIDNLIDNALKYSPPGSPVELSVTSGATTVAILVADRGIGVDDGEAPHLFEPFYRSPEVRRRGLAGVGLGLAVARRIVTTMGGTIDVEGRPEGGTVFAVRFPGTPGAEGREPSRGDATTPSPALP